MVDSILTVEVKADGDACWVDPGELDVRSHQKVLFKNETGGDIWISFSEESLFLDSTGTPKSKTYLAVSSGEELTVNKIPRGVYPYAVYCAIGNDFATASSMPIIIVRR